MLLNSKIVNKGWKMKPFSLLSVSGNYINCQDIKKPNGLVIAFICNHCPYVKDIVNRMVKDFNELINLDVGIIEIIDIRTLNPIDYKTIEESISKTGKVLIVYEDNITNGPGAEISSIISDKFFDLLDGPVKRIASEDSPIPYNPYLEEKVLIQTADIASAINSLLEY